MVTDADRRAEAEKYEKLYQPGHLSVGITGKAKPYGVMAPSRGERITATLRSAWDDGCRTLVDVGCGTGWLLGAAEKTGWAAWGVDVVDRLCDGGRVVQAYAHALPFLDAAVDLVTCTDVMEHILEDDVPLVLSELWRVARKQVYLTVSHRESERDGMNLHVTMRPVEWWMLRFVDAFGDFRVEHRTGKNATEMFWSA